MHLEMGTMSLPEYHQMFDHLAEFGQDLVNTNKRRCDMFVKGMHLKLHEYMSTASREDFGLICPRRPNQRRLKLWPRTARGRHLSIPCVRAAIVIIHASVGGVWGCAWATNPGHAFPTAQAASQAQALRPAPSQRSTAGSHLQRQQQRPPQLAAQH
ncbi:unnamed protein product [Cuscuta campestris]|uniref:Retrotransposon gag domain-containing protein n=1 Tax=Cuscuta campestris TaxID=132261 RepID=A0A484MJK5_9ASTE|nr:unnamed protein product [Cuscuta campestris]